MPVYRLYEETLLEKWGLNPDPRRNEHFSASAPSMMGFLKWEMA
jgi:hypothetical protein